MLPIPGGGYPIEIFYSYADIDRDKKLFEELKAHLITLRTQQLIAEWDHSQITLGRISQETVAHLQTAQIIILLISTSFFASPQCLYEMEQAWKHYEERRVYVIPVLLRPCNLSGTLIERLPILPRNGVPVTGWADQDAALLDVANDIRKVIDVARRYPPLPPLPPSAPPSLQTATSFPPPSQPPAPFLKRFIVPIILAILLICSAGFNVFQLYLLTHQQVPNPSSSYYGDNGIGTEQITVNSNLLRIGIIDEHSTTPFNQLAYSPLQCEENSYNEACIENDIFTANKKIGHAPHFTLIVVTTLDQSASDPQLSLRVGLDDLSGAYMAQQNYNGQSQIKLRLLIANLGTKDAATQTVDYLVPQILQAAHYDKSIAGIVGFPFSQSAKNAMDRFQNLLPALPIVSPSASSTTLTSDYANFYRIVPPDSEQGPAISAFIQQMLPFKRIAVFYDPADAYSASLGNSVLDTLHGDKEIYTVGRPDTLSAKVQNVLHNRDDMIFFAGYSDDLNALKTILKGSTRQNIRIVGGEGLYDLGGYTANNYANLYFAAYSAYAELSSRLNPDCLICSGFMSTYRQDFDSQNLFPGQYGHTLPGSHVLQTYDAVTAFLTVASKLNGVPTRTDMLNRLPGIFFNGVSGYIQFTGKNSDPLNKVLYLACTDSAGDTHVIAQYTPDAAGGQNPFTYTDPSNPLQSCPG